MKSFELDEICYPSTKDKTGKESGSVPDSNDESSLLFEHF